MTQSITADHVVHNQDESRFELTVDGHMAVAEYILADGVITFTHTAVPPEIRSRGIGNRLARAALDFARAQELSVVARCPFIAAWIRRHAEYQSLLVDS